MAKISFIRPLDQPLGTRRLLSDLISLLQSEEYNELFIIVAYAKTGPLYRLYPYLKEWKEKGKSANIILGIDQQGTSYEALEFALGIFDNVYITRERSITFHPKIYTFLSKKKVRTFIGSNNLTIGGTERNFETLVDLDLNVENDMNAITEIKSFWEMLLPSSCPITEKLDTILLNKLFEENIIIDEKSLQNKRKLINEKTRKSNFFGRLQIKPGSNLPKNINEAINKNRIKIKPITITQKNAIISGLVIQIKPHHNGEIFLSFVAVKQHPDFFRWPFTGRTIPKKMGNPSYPQLIPDPVVNISVYGNLDTPLLVLNNYHLNTIFYEAKKEIRITASPLVNIVPEYSIMIMENGREQGIDYEITIFTQDNENYDSWLEKCNQQMPSGGKQPRKFGWF
ncbi:MAG: phospholipase D family protein [Treponema sp.]|nr:phospholipase D family protein [Treponema sp.]